MANTSAKGAGSNFGFPKKNSTRDSESHTTRRSRIATARRKTHNAVKERERGRCGICKWNPGSDCHHVYGRSRDPNNWRERPEACMWVCRTCHPTGFLTDRGADPELENILEECIKEERIPVWMPTMI